MSRPPLEELLQPSLQAGELREPPYSVRANFFVAFFGGLLAGATLALLNSMRTQRVARDAPWLGLLACGSIAFSIWSGYVNQTNSIPDWMSVVGEPRQGIKLLGRVLSLLGFGVIYLFQREMHETRDLRGQDAPSPWKAGIVLCLGGTAVQFVLVLVGMRLGQG